jgi:hypothetical protein
MTTQVPRTLTLLLDGAPGGPLAGTIVDERGRRRPFAGWLGLAEALEAHLAVPDTPTEPLETGSAR